MPISRSKKEKILGDLNKKLQKAKFFILLNYLGVSVPEIQKLRKLLKKENIEYLVVKKTLIKKALLKSNMKGIDLKDFKTPVSIVISEKADPLPAKLIKNFQKETKKMEFIKGFLEDRILDKNSLKMLADIPSREELLSALLGSISAPIRGLVLTLGGGLNNLVHVLSAIRDKKS